MLRSPLEPLVYFLHVFGEEGAYCFTLVSTSFGRTYPSVSEILVLSWTGGEHLKLILWMLASARKTCHVSADAHSLPIGLILPQLRQFVSVAWDGADVILVKGSRNSRSWRYKTMPGNGGWLKTFPSFSTGRNLSLSLYEYAEGDEEAGRRPTFTWAHVYKETRNKHRRRTNAQCWID